MKHNVTYEIKGVKPPEVAANTVRSINGRAWKQTQRHAMDCAFSGQPPTCNPFKGSDENTIWWKREWVSAYEWALNEMES